MKDKLVSIIKLLIIFIVIGVSLKVFRSKSGRKNVFDNNSKKLKVVTTTGILEDTVKNIAGDVIELVSLMGSGVDPHSYKATPGDLKILNNADIIIYNGLHLEGKLADVLSNFNKVKPTYAAGECLDKSEIISDDEFAEGVDPHIWFDIKLWKKVVLYICKILIEHNPDNRDIFKQRSERYIKDLDKLDEWISTNMQKIPSSQRILITAHDAFGYFGRAYNVRVKGLQGISTASDYGLKDITGLIDLIIKNNIKSIFIETSVPQKPIMAVIEGCNDQGHPLKLGGALFSDALGEKGTPEGTYIGMLTANVNTIVRGLGSQY